MVHEMHGSLCLFFGLAVVRLIVAFDIEAHDAIGQTCASAMDQMAIKEVKRLLGGQDASDVAGWGHQVDDTYPDMARLHFQVHSDSAESGSSFCAQPRMVKCEDNICLLSAIKHFYGKVLKSEGRHTNFPAIDYDKIAKGIKFTDADSVKMLINLIGDLHQPLHVGYAGDDNGRNIKVTFRGEVKTLFEIWDNVISEVVRRDESHFWLGGWTHISRVAAEFERDKAKWKEDGAEKTFNSWLEESVEFACNTAYKHPITGKRLAGPEAEAGPVEIDDAAYQVWREMWLKQILIAGERTAVVLNDILDAGGASKLHQGSGVQTKADVEKAKEKAEWEKERKEHRAKDSAGSRKGQPQMNWNAFLTNLGIAAVTIPVFILVVNYGLNPKVYAHLIKSLLDESAAKSTGAGTGNSVSGKRWE